MNRIRESICVESLVNAVESLVDLFESSVDLFEPPVNFFKSPINHVELNLSHVEAKNHLGLTCDIIPAARRQVFHQTVSHAGPQRFA